MVGEAVDVLGNALILLDRRLHLKHVNLAAERLLAAGAPLSLRRGRLAIADPIADERLRAAVARVFSRRDSIATAVPVRSAAGRQLNLTVVGVPSGGGRLALLLASAAPADDDSRVERLRAFYGLSSGEARLAVMLAEGSSPAEIADCRGVAIGTVRAQIKGIASKLGCRRQSEIVRAVADLPRLLGS